MLLGAQGAAGANAYQLNITSSISRTCSTGCKGSVGSLSGTGSTIAATGRGGIGLPSGKTAGVTGLGARSLTVQVKGALVGSACHGPRAAGGIGLGSPSPEMAENVRFRLSLADCGEGSESVAEFLAAASSASATLAPSLPSILLILSANSLM